MSQAVLGTFWIIRISTACSHHIQAGQAALRASILTYMHGAINTSASTLWRHTWLGLLRVLEYSLLSISGCKFPFQVAVFWQSVDELVGFMATWGFVISFATCQTGNRSESIHACMYSDRAPGTLTHHPFFVIGSVY